MKRRITCTWDEVLIKTKARWTWHAGEQTSPIHKGADQQHGKVDRKVRDTWISLVNADVGTQTGVDPVRGFGTVNRVWGLAVDIRQKYALLDSHRST